jgi:hypothetical protein
VILGIVVVFLFASFIASFWVDLDDANHGYLQLFSGLCGRLPLIVSISSSLIFQDLMDKTALKARNARQTTEMPFI